MYLDNGKSVFLEWMNKWMSGVDTGLRRTSLTVINALLTHSFKRWFELVYVPLESYFSSCSPDHQVGASALLLLSHFVQMHSCPSSPIFLGGWAWEFPDSERDESERRLIQKVTRSEQQCCPLVELSLFPCTPWDSWLVAPLSSRSSGHTAQGFVSLTLALPLV